MKSKVPCPWCGETKSGKRIGLACGSYFYLGNWVQGKECMRNQIANLEGDAQLVQAALTRGWRLSYSEGLYVVEVPYPSPCTVSYYSRHAVLAEAILQAIGVVDGEGLPYYAMYSLLINQVYGSTVDGSACGPDRVLIPITEAQANDLRSIPQELIDEYVRRHREAAHE